MGCPYERCITGYCFPTLSKTPLLVVFYLELLVEMEIYMPSFMYMKKPRLIPIFISIFFLVNLKLHELSKSILNGM